MRKPKRIDRNDYLPERILDIVRADPAGIGRDELLRLLEESAHAYMMLRENARDLVLDVQESMARIQDKRFMSRLHW